MKRLYNLIILLTLFFTLQPTHAQAVCDPNAVIAVASISSSGTPAHGFTKDQQILSADGRYVIFESASNDLIPDDPDSTNDIFVHDRETCETRRVSVNSSGERWDINDTSATARIAISGDGRYVVFASAATNLIPNDINNWTDIFAHDIQTGQTQRVAEGSEEPTISASGRYIAFSSSLDNLVPNDTNNWTDIFVLDRDTDSDGIFDEDSAIETTRVSVSSNGIQGNSSSSLPFLSGDGRYVAFASDASNLVSGDTNTCSITQGVGHCPDIFVHDRQTGKTTRVSVNNSGIQGNSYSYRPMLSAGGRFVIFYSEASNLVNNDHNLTWDLFIHDRQTRQIRRIANTQDVSSISGDGLFIAFASASPNLVPNDSNTCLNYETPPGACPDIFVQDLVTGEIARVSVADDGTQADDYNMIGLISSDGRSVAFVSLAGTLVPGAGGQTQRVYITRNPLAPLAAPLRNNFDNATPTLTWNRLSWATAYHVQVARDSNFSDIVFEDGNLPFDSLEVMVTPPLTEGRYYWRVRGLTDTSEGAWSVINSFTIE